MLPIKFIPVYAERVWGGRALETLLRRSIPPNKKIGESREISDRPEAVSVVAEGEFCGRTLREILTERGNEILGDGVPAGTRFPLIVKWLDCAEKSSLQVHPTAEAAARFGGEKKTEAWYFFRTAPGADFFAGLRGGVDAETLRRAVAAGTPEPLLLRHRSAAGTALVLHAGTVHSSGAGNVILEIQESSDSTFRLYDWARLDASGKPRRLHLEEALASIDFEKNAEAHFSAARRENSAPRTATPGGKVELCRCESFSMSRVELAADGAPYRVPAREQARVVVVLSGTLRIENADENSSGVPAASCALDTFGTALLPFCSAFRLCTADGNAASFILVENFGAAAPSAH